MRAPLLLALLLYGCGSELDLIAESEGEPGIPAPQFSDIQARVLNPRCAPCHRGDRPDGGLDLSPHHAYEALVAGHDLEEEGHDEEGGHVLVLPGDPDESFLVHKLRGDLPPSQGAQMPLGRRPLPEGTILAIEEWIALGAQQD